MNRSTIIWDAYGLTAVLWLDGIRYEKPLNSNYLFTPIYKIMPTENQLASPQWLAANKWKPVPSRAQ